MPKERKNILSRYGFELDRFQIEAIDAFDRRDHVIVAAPTGSGKTVIAEYGLAVAINNQSRAFYTTPIKALSNQKYRDLVEIHGGDHVGLLTGDNAINGNAPIVVMTTEVLRNMIYAGRDLSSLAVVVVDEVHFLQDSYRGPVWEEVIIHLPAHVQLVCLSATVSNSAELAEWVETVRGSTTAVVETRRPVELENLYLVDDRTHGTLRMYPTIIKGEPNSDALRLDASAVRTMRGRGARHQRGRKGSGKRYLATPDRVEVVDRLVADGLTPAIYFIFSRNQCSETAQRCVLAGMSFTDEAERERIGELVDQRLGELDRNDLAVLGFDAFSTQLLAGIAAHHAGMVPPFKEVVEQCFIEGLLKVVFATETLAVGVNMPARSVVIDKLTKFTGDHHEALTPAQYSQLTGRAGRRGLDDKGSAVVLWSPFVRFEQAAELALSRAFHLRSAFRPTYNMAANLVRTYDRETARQLLSLSFAQFQADRSVVRYERRLQRQRRRLEELLSEAESPFGDIDAYRHDIETANGQRGRDDLTELAMVRLRPGQLIHANKGTHKGPVAVVATAFRKGGLKVTAITPAGDIMKLGGDDFVAPPQTIGEISLPGSFSPNQRSYRIEVGKRVQRAKLRAPRSDRSAAMSEHALPGTGLHPVEADPDLPKRLATLETADKVRVEVEQLETRIQRSDATLNRQFDSVLGVLSELGYIDSKRWLLTERGETLARTFHETDLLICEAIQRGILDGLDAGSLAGMVSTFIYEHRSPDDPPPAWFPNRDVRRRFDDLARLSDHLAAMETRFDLNPHRNPDPTFFAVAYAWVCGDGFAEVVGEEELAGGDFVRNIKQLVDLLTQIAIIAPDRQTRRAAGQASEAAFRGVIADSSTVGDHTDP